MLSDEARAALAKVRKLAEGKPWYRPPPPRRPPLAVVRPEPPTPPPIPPPAPKADAATTRPTATTTAPPRLPLIAEVRTEPGKPWFTCIAGQNPVTGEWPTLETLRAQHRTKWGEQCETRLKEASQ